MAEMNNKTDRTVLIAVSFVVGVYAWLAAVSFGMVLLDILYAGMVTEARAALSEAADFMLLINALMLLAGFLAIGFSWNLRATRNLIAISLSLIFLGFCANMLLSPVITGGSSSGAAIRILLTGSVSVPAFIGFYKMSSRNARKAL